MKTDAVYCTNCKSLAVQLRNVSMLYADIIYGEWQDVPLEELISCLKPGGAFWLQTDYRSVAQLKVLLDNIKDVRFVNWVVYPYNWGGRPRDAFGRKHDDLLYYVKTGAQSTFNAKAVSIKKAVMMNSTKDWQIPTDVWWDIGNFHTTSPERIQNPKTGKGYIWQKPERLMERILLSTTNKGDLVFEPYLGTGSMCAVAKKHGRHYIGCDTNKKMVEVSKRRLEKI